MQIDQKNQITYYRWRCKYLNPIDNIIVMLNNKCLTAILLSHCKRNYGNHINTKKANLNFSNGYQIILETRFKNKSFSLKHKL